MLKRVLCLSLALLAGGCSLYLSPFQKVPQIIREIPPGTTDIDEEFNRLLLAAFPLPIAEDELTAELKEQGFAVNAETNGAGFSWNGFPCTLVWSINWEEEEGSVSDLNSRFGAICL